MNDTSEPAFPVFPETGGGHAAAFQGMTLRDYFAAQAMTGAQVWDAVLNGKNAVLAGNGTDTLAEIAYAVADAMLKARQE